jgi:tyrosyl-tRNA synthetase
LVDVVAGTPLASSLSDARRSVAQGALYVNGERADPERRLTAGDLLHGRWILLRKGKRTHHLLEAG